MQPAALGNEKVDHSRGSSSPGFSEIEERALVDPGHAIQWVHQHLAQYAAALLQDSSPLKASSLEAQDFALGWFDARGNGSLENWKDAGRVVHFETALPLPHPDCRSLAGLVRHDGGVAGFVLLPGSGQNINCAPFSAGGFPGVTFQTLAFDWPAHDDVWALWLAGEAGETVFCQVAVERWLLLSAILLGSAQAAFNYVLDYSRERTAFGKPIAQHQAVALQLASIATELEATRLLGENARSDEINQESALETAAGIWAYTRDITLRLGPRILQLMGGHGYLEMHAVQQRVRDIQFLSSFGELPDAFAEKL